MRISFHPQTPDQFRDPAALRGTPLSAGIDLRIAEFAHPEVDTAYMIDGTVIDVTFHIAVDLATTFDEPGSPPLFAVDEDPPVVGAGLIVPRSGLGARGLTLVNGTGVIDVGYTSLLRGTLVYRARPGVAEPLILNRWDRVAQLLIIPALRPPVEVVEHMAAQRGGFGSTGVV
jgi:dUTP pyrophosphatase